MIAFNCQKSVLLVILCLCFLEFSLSKGTRGVRPRDSGLSRRVLKGNKEDSNEIKYAEISEDEDFTYIQFDDGSKDDKGDAAMVSSMDEEISSTNSTIDQQSVYHVKAKSPASKKKKAKKSRDTSKQKNSKLTRGSKILVKSHDEMAMPSTSVKEGSTTTLSSMDDIPEVDGVMDVGAGTILPDNASEDNATEDNAILPMDSRATLEPSSSPSTNGDQPTPLPSMFVTIIQSEANSQAQATNAPTIFPDNTSEDNVTLPTESPVTPEASSSPSVNEDQPTPLPSMFVTIIQSEADSQTQTTNAPTMETATIIAPTTAPIQATVPPTTGCPNRADIDGE